MATMRPLGCSGISALSSCPHAAMVVARPRLPITAVGDRMRWRLTTQQQATTTTIPSATAITASNSSGDGGDEGGGGGGVPYDIPILSTTYRLETNAPTYRTQEQFLTIPKTVPLVGRSLTPEGITAILNAKFRELDLLLAAEVDARQGLTRGAVIGSGVLMALVRTGWLGPNATCQERPDNFLKDACLH